LILQINNLSLYEREINCFQKLIEANIETIAINTNYIEKKF